MGDAAHEDSLSIWRRRWDEHKARTGQPPATLAVTREEFQRWWATEMLHHKDRFGGIPRGDEVLTEFQWPPQGWVFDGATVIVASES